MPLALTRPQARSSQPQGAARINWANPATLGLRALFDTGAGVELLTGRRSSVNTSTSQVSLLGRAAGFASTANQRWTHHPNFAITGDLSIVVLCDVDALSGYGALIAKQGTTTTNAPYELRLGATSTDSKLNLLRANAGGYGARTASFGNIFSSAQKSVCFAVSVQSGIDPVGNVYVAGDSTVYSFSGAGGAAASDNGADVWIGRRYDGATQLTGKIYYIALYDRRLSESEARGIVSNPWQLFASDPRPLWIPLAAGGDVTVAITGVSASGQVGALAAALSKAMTGNAATGAVGSLLASLSASVSGNAATGAVGVLSKAISTALTGLSATGAAGTVTASVGGDVTVALTGVSAAVAAGTVVPGLLVSMSGHQATGAAGSVATPRTVGLTGSQAVGAAGTVTASGGVVQVRSKGLRKTRYVPGRVPFDAGGLPQFLQSETERINDALESPFTHQLLSKLYEEPSRKQADTALICYADGTTWNPGSGEGIYAYYAGSWKKLG